MSGSVAELILSAHVGWSRVTPTFLLFLQLQQHHVAQLHLPCWWSLKHAALEFVKCLLFFLFLWSKVFIVFQVGGDIENRRSEKWERERKKREKNKHLIGTKHKAVQIGSAGRVHNDSLIVVPGPGDYSRWEGVPSLYSHWSHLIKLCSCIFKVDNVDKAMNPEWLHTHVWSKPVL